MKAQMFALLLLAVSWNLPKALAAPSSPGGEEKAKGSKAQGPAGKPAAAGKKQRGKASYYSRKFSGKKMADGTPMNPNANVAASKSLPLGTKAEVKNLKTGKSTVVDIRDRGPYVKGRIIDLSPKAAEQLDMKKDGVAPVEVTPLQVPPPKAGNPAGTKTDGR